jgi:hypothetical protein
MESMRIRIMVGMRAFRGIEGLNPSEPYSKALNKAI